MSNPSNEQIDASIEALYADSRTWSDMAGELDRMERAARGLTLNTFEFSGLAHFIGLDSLYNSLQEQMVFLLKQASTNFDNVAVALNTAADGYSRDEENAVHRLRKIY